MYVVIKFESFWKKKEFPIAHIYIYIYHFELISCMRF